MRSLQLHLGRGAKWLAVTSGLSILAACSRDAPEPTATSGPAGESAALSTSPTAAPRGTLDERFAALADEMPGFGGFFFDESGVLVANFSRQADVRTVRARVADFMVGEMRASTAARGLANSRASTMRVRPVKYDFRQLLTWYRQILPLADGRSGATMTDIDEVRNRIVIGVSDASFIGPMRASIARLGLPNDLVDVVQEDASRPQHHSGPTLRDQWDPVPDGVQVHIFEPGAGVGNECSVGFNLTGGGTDRFFVTNTHCTDNRAQVTGALAFQAAQPRQIATEVIDPDWLTYEDNPVDCPSPRICRYSDAAGFRYLDPSKADHGHVAIPGSYGGITVNEFWRISNWETPYVGMTITKIGRSTGRQPGSVTQTCVHMLMAGTDNQWFLCQSKHNAPSGDGDSGGPIVARISADVAYAVGIHWAASGGFSPFYSIQNEFYESAPQFGLLDAATTDPPLPPPIQVTISGTGKITSAGSYTWTANATGGTGTYSNYQWERSDDWGPYYPVGSNSTTYNAFIDSGNSLRLRVTVTSGSDLGVGNKSVIIQIW